MLKKENFVPDEESMCGVAYSPLYVLKGKTERLVLRANRERAQSIHLTERIAGRLLSRREDVSEDATGSPLSVHRTIS